MQFLYRFLLALVALCHVNRAFVRTPGIPVLVR